MNVQDRITLKEGRLYFLEDLYDKKLSEWTQEELFEFTDKLSLEIQIASIKINIVELILRKPWEEWTEEEKRLFGDHQQLRTKEQQLRTEKEQLGKQLLSQQRDPQPMQVIKLDEDKMDVDSPVVTVKDAMKKLTEMIGINGQQKILSIHDILEKLNLDKSPLNINVYSIDYVPNLLYSQEIYDDEKEIGIEMPVDKLCTLGYRTIVLLGVSGCGKTRTCYDFCRRQWALYFDCSIDEDFLEMIHKLKVIRPKVKRVCDQSNFELESKRLFRCLIASRLFTLKTLCESNPKLGFFDWLCIQKSSRSGIVFLKMFNLLASLPWSVVDDIYGELRHTFRSSGGRLIFDESQALLSHLKEDYHSIKLDKSAINTDGQFVFPRPFFTFLARTVIDAKFKSIWCGTQMRISNMEHFCSAAGKKPESICVFTDFTFLEASHIYKLMQKWLNVESVKITLLEEISYCLQGRPRFFASFLHSLVESSDIEACFKSYINDMTTGSGQEETSPYCFWRDRIDWTIQTIQKTNSYSFEKKQVSDTLLKLCISYLFGDGSSIEYSREYDLVATNLVMIKKVNDWRIMMSEPIVLIAGLNYMADVDQDRVINYFTNQLFAPPGTSFIPQQRGHIMELVIALRFRQCWWKEEKMKQYLPLWARDWEIPNPRGTLDCRQKDVDGNMFIQQLCNPEFPWILLPSVYAGPDIRYSIFSCCIKTTFTPNSNSTFLVSDECKKNILSMQPKNWYKSKTSIHNIISKEIKNKRFVHIRFELPDTATELAKSFESKEDGDDYIICVNLSCEFAKDFFGEYFVARYKKFVSQELTRRNEIKV